MEVNRDAGLEPGETFCLCVSPSPSPVSRFPLYCPDPPRLTVVNVNKSRNTRFNLILFQPKVAHDSPLLGYFPDPRHAVWIPFLLSTFSLCTISKIDNFLHRQMRVFVLRGKLRFLDASTHLYKRLCPSVGRSVRPSVGPSVTRFSNIAEMET